MTTRQSKPMASGNSHVYTGDVRLDRRTNDRIYIGDMWYDGNGRRLRAVSWDGNRRRLEPESLVCTFGLIERRGVR